MLSLRAARPISGDGMDFAARPAPEFAPAGYRDAAFPPDQPEFAIASPVRIAQEMFRIAAGEYDELHEAATLADPELTLVIGFGSGGQDRNSQALMHLPSLKADTTSERWIRRMEVPAHVTCTRFALPAPPGRFHH